MKHIRRFAALALALCIALSCAASLAETVYKEGDAGSEILAIKERMLALGYYTGTISHNRFNDTMTQRVKQLQKNNGLPETGIADEATQRVLFSARAMEGEEYVFPYKIVVDISEQRVYVGEWRGESYEGPIHTYKCATGKVETPTPLGTYQAGGRCGGEWYYFKDFNCYAKWAYQIVGGILFHSNTVNSTKQKPSDHNLGHRASHGCIRMPMDGVKWIYDNCPEGTTVVIQE